MSLSLPELPSPVSLRRLFPNASFVGCGDVVVQDATEDSRQAGPETVFAAIPGTQVDGCRFASNAVDRGCRVILTERPLPGIAARQCIVRDVRMAYARLCDAVSGWPTSHLRIAGITGTNGKTTTAWMIRSILEAAGNRCGMLGTVEYADGRTSEPAALTTPDARTASRWFRRMLEAGSSHASVELSSHALDQRRIAGTPLSAAVVTNVTQDHFDYHNSFDEYLSAKSRIFDYVTRDGVIVINLDDPSSEQLVEQARETARRILTFSTNPACTEADIRASVLDESIAGSHFRMAAGESDIEVRIPLAGSHNIQNSLAAAAVALHFGVSPGAVAAGLETPAAVPGRLERIENDLGFEVFVDYAHTDDALRRVLETVKNVTSGRVICVFGAGGDRDDSKRPLLAKAAAAADIAIVTSDNPRTENPQTIIEDILSGFPTGFTSFHTEVNRERAIAFALDEADAGDSIVVAGKGHETRQIIGSEQLEFDDRQVLRKLLAQRSPVERRQQVPA